MSQRVPGYCTLCRSRCGAVYTVDHGRLTGVEPDPTHPTGTALCPKGRAAPEIAHSPRRLRQPLRRTTPKSDPDPRWEPIGWDEAMAEVAERLHRIRSESGPEAVAFAVTSPSGTGLSDSIDWIERFIRLFGSPNICYSTEVCNWHKDFAHAFTFGCGLPAPDYQGSDLTVLWGHNPARTWLAQSAALAEARARGTRLAVIDPRRTGALDAEHWLRVRPGTDAALALGIAGLLLEAKTYDEAFLRAWSNAPLLVRTDTGRFLRADELEPGLPGFAAFDERCDTAVPYDTTRFAVAPERFALHGTRRIRTRDGEVECVPAFDRYAEACAAWPVDRTSAETGVDEHALRSFAEALGQARSVTYHGWSGVGQHTNATQTDRAIATLYALTGSFDAPGGNVVLPGPAVNPVDAADELDPDQRAKALGLAEHPLGPPAQGWISARALCRAVLSGEPYRVRAMLGFGSNLLVSQPDPRRTAEALRHLEFFVHLDLFANPTAEFADIVLPVNSPWEHDGLRAGFGSSLRAQEHVQYRPRMVPPVGQSRSDTEVVFDLADRLGMRERFFGGDPVAGWNYRLRPLGLTVERLRKHPGGVRVPLTTRYRKYTELNEDGTVTGFATPTARVELYSQRLAEYGHSPVPVHQPRPRDDRFPLVLTCAKNGYYCHSQHRGLSSLRRRSPEPRVELSAELATARGIRDGQWVLISTRNASVRMRAAIDSELHPEVVVAEYGWWQGAPDLGLPGYDPMDQHGSNYNLLIDDTAHDPISGSVPMRSTPCDVRPEPDSGWAQLRRFVVDSRVERTDEVSELVLTPADGKPLPDYRPGQHVTVELDPSGNGSLRRSYSLIGPATAAHRAAYRIAVRRIEGGAGSTHVHDHLRPGDTVALAAPAGPFAIPTDIEFPVVLIAAGIGITPFLSYLETLADIGGTVPEVVVHYGTRGRSSDAYADRLSRLRALLPRLSVRTYYSRPDPRDQPGRDFDRLGRVSADDVAGRLIQQRARFYLCGPEGMIRDVSAGLRERGVPRFDIFSERFHTPRTEVSLPERPATVHFARTGRSAHWTPAAGTVLDVAEREGIELPSGCRTGQCESCATTLLRGEVAHLVPPTDDLPDEVCLTCQAMPAGDITLDA